MRKITTFAALMAAGVLIVLIYVWSGESLVALLASLAALMAGALLIDRLREPTEGSEVGSGGGLAAMWGTARQRLAPMLGDDHEAAAVGGQGAGGDGSAGHKRGAADGGRPAPPPPLTRSERGQAWRSQFDVTFDAQGLSGVTVGSEAPQTWRWEQIDDVGHDLYRAVDSDGSADERVALRLDIPDQDDPTEPASVMVTLGPQQQLAEVVARLRAAWQADKRASSRLENLPPLQRTRLLAEHLGGTDILATMPTTTGQSADAFHQQVRRELLAEGWLYRLNATRSFDDLLDAYEGLLEASGLEPIDQSEFDRFTAAEADGVDGSALHRALDSTAEKRGFRIVYLDDGSGDLMMGLIPDETVDDWDGQTVGAGNVKVVTEPPR